VVANFVENFLLPNGMVYKFFIVVFTHILSTEYRATQIIFYSPVMRNKIQDEI